MQNEYTHQPNSKSDASNDIETLEAEVRDAIAHGSHIQETVYRLTLKAMNAQHINIESLGRIITAVMQGVHDGATQQLQRAANQTQNTKSQITEGIAGLDSALADFAEASKLAVEEVAGQAKKFSDTELKRTRSDLESLESLFLETLHHTATTAQGMIADILLDLSHHAKNTGTIVGSQLKETLAIFTQQIASVGHSQLETGISLAQKTADFVNKIAEGVLSGIKDQSKTDHSH
ncbi:DUF6781 family protein [Nitrosomonas sp. Nm166]|uniref:DUF6781 family protein n=1 Tax=Nitrosomonas sp. Nm166 TaxID=1881054 RepID=UPI0008E225A7|nr:DUF6781 family protein [Nitrosomonas sp. Nm166]SFE17083.1 hypothetical protein SAMN05428977_100856 [Nitrosomonas sp. Nm166]